MGTWGAALYDDDTASDLRNALAVVCKVPADGDRLLELLAEMYPQRDPADDDGALFWLVTADQFERRGIACAAVTATALSIIEQGTDLTRPGRAAPTRRSCASARRCSTSWPDVCEPHAH
jgi:hypothetical protein